ncbi:hypothetical protein O4328_42220 [Rhodococcus opacus]|uniref:Uncharacterized protein n=1 Tax=Rhodococcus opacus TaxID=37919 RepID=A0AAX3YUU8_RHOOP|nr:hypothetical protein [Rhodococcus opacus]MCZ4590165.1 hypothetical protein [Rhodococcus opacus]WLF52201.1 hypothetical protein Q5707_43085 [Rhodococcus opacus]
MGPFLADDIPATQDRGDGVEISDSAPGDRANAGDHQGSFDAVRALLRAEIVDDIA